MNSKKIMISGLLLITLLTETRAQENATAANGSRTSASASDDCKQISGATVAAILSSSTFKELSVRLDRDKSHLKIGDKAYYFKMAEQKIKKPGYDWKYFVNDINSFRHELKFEKNSFYLFIEFEGNGSEIKGKCPGCANAFEDRRAPDVDWEGKRRIKIKMKPVAYLQSITFQVEKTEVEGKFELNGPMDVIMPTLNILEALMNKMGEAQVKKFLGEASVKQKISDAMKPVVSQLGLSKISKVYVAEEQLLVCGSATQKVIIRN